MLDQETPGECMRVNRKIKTHHWFSILTIRFPPQRVNNNNNNLSWTTALHNTLSIALHAVPHCRHSEHFRNKITNNKYNKQFSHILIDKYARVDLIKRIDFKTNRSLAVADDPHIRSPRPANPLLSICVQFFHSFVTRKLCEWHCLLSSFGKLDLVWPRLSVMSCVYRYNFCFAEVCPKRQTTKRTNKKKWFIRFFRIIWQIDLLM